MLVLTRKLNESIVIGDNVEVSVLEILHDRIKIGISASRLISVHRKEIYDSIHAQNINASKTPVHKIENLLKVLKIKK